MTNTIFASIKPGSFEYIALEPFLVRKKTQEGIEYLLEFQSSSDLTNKDELEDIIADEVFNYLVSRYLETIFLVKNISISVTVDRENQTHTIRMSDGTLCRIEFIYDKSVYKEREEEIKNSENEDSIGMYAEGEDIGKIFLPNLSKLLKIKPGKTELENKALVRQAILSLMLSGVLAEQRIEFTASKNQQSNSYRIIKKYVEAPLSTFLTAKQGGKNRRR